MAEVAAVRVYTTMCYHLINTPLRRILKEYKTRLEIAKSHQEMSTCTIADMETEHPLKFTTYLIYRAVKKLRACNMYAFDTRAYTRYLWRGLKDRRTEDAFMKQV